MDKMLFIIMILMGVMIMYFKEGLMMAGLLVIVILVALSINHTDKTGEQ